MSIEAETGKPADLRALSDKELIKRFCPDEKDCAAIEELWRRHEKTAYEILVRISRSLCPAFFDPGDLAHTSYLRARDNFKNRICGFKELDSPRSFKAWLRELATKTMLDERRILTQSRRKRKIIEVSIEKPPEEDEQERLPEVTEETLLELPELRIRRKPGPVDFDEPLEERSDYEYFRSWYSTSPLDPAAPVEWKQVEQERKSIFRKVLTRHAENSDEDATCAAMIRLRYWRKWPVKKLVERFHGAPTTERQRAAKERACYRLLNKDYEDIAADLRRMYGIVRPGQV